MTDDKPVPDWLNGLRQALVDQGMNWSMLAHHVGISPGSVASVFKGRATPRADTMRRLVDGLFPAGSTDGEALVEDYKKHTAIEHRYSRAGLSPVREIWQLHTPGPDRLCVQDGQVDPCATRRLIDNV